MQSPEQQNGSNLDPLLNWEALLNWYVAMGVDLGVGDVPQDRFAQSLASLADKPEVAPPQGEARPSQAHRHGAPTISNSALGAEIGLKGAEIAAAAKTLTQLRDSLDVFDQCALKATAARLVFEDGSPSAKIMLIGDTPGADDEREGRPFSGRVGALLDKMLAAIGLDRAQVYLANIVPWRPPGNRMPNPREIEQLRPFVLRQIELVAPDFMVPLGVLAMQTLLQTGEPLMRMRGRKMDYVLLGQKIPALPMLHPLFLLNQPSHKRNAWLDLQALRRLIEKQ